MNRASKKIHWTTKALSMTKYINEVSIDGKKTSRFNFRLGYIDLYTEQVMRSGNCLTLLSTSPSFSLETFKNSNLLEDVVKYVFLTFNVAFLHRVERYLFSLSADELNDCYTLLQANPEPYAHVGENEPDEELIWCKIKNEKLKGDSRFTRMYQRDADNRIEIIKLLKNCLLATEVKRHAQSENKIPLFLQMVNPVFDSAENTLNYIEATIIEAKFPHNIFRPIEKNKKGNNQTGLNAEIAAMIHVFQEKGYFKSDLTFKDLFISFGKYTNNRAGKDYDFAFFSQDFNFKKYLNLLQCIVIKEFSK